MTEPRKHHFLPKFYLRRFSDDDKTLIQIEKVTGKYYGVSINDAAAIRDYHHIDHEEITDPNALEKELSRVESIFAGALEKLLVEGFINNENKFNLAELVAMLRVRVPAFKRYIDKSLQELVKTTGKIMDRKGALPPKPKGYEDILNFDNIDVTISNWKCLELMFMLAADPDLINILAAMRPTVYRAPKDKAFITGDQPVAVYNSAATPESVYGFGLIDKRTEVTIPLSTKVIVRLDWSKGKFKERFATLDEVKEYNRRTIIMAEKLLFSSSVDKNILKFIKKHSNCFAGMDINIMDLGLSAYHISRFKPVMKESNY